MSTPRIEVDVQIDGADVRAGTLYSHRGRGTESATFTYEDAWIADPRAFALDPSLPLAAGAFQTPVGVPMFGAFRDSAPDRWGRRLMQRRLRRAQTGGGVASRTLGEIDYLLGVRDVTRQGAVRFRRAGEQEYLSPTAYGVPQLVDLPRLLAASLDFERGSEDDAEIAILFRAGSSLGGARPKANVVDHSGGLAIAKFPSAGDAEWSVTAWERVALVLAGRAGIDVPRSEIVSIAGRDVLLVDRFDRRPDGRIGYVSAMTMLEATDGDRRSYLEIAELIEQESPSTTRDLHELWRRIAFSVLISNTDDHLRNHGFLRSEARGWRLAPAFDLNPNPEPGAKHLSTAIDLDDTSASLERVLEVSPYFRLDEAAARTEIATIACATSGWRSVAAGLGIAAGQIAAMEPAFEHDQQRAAARLRAS
jgi:serine/threonine-protein kinase HipA